MPHWYATARVARALEPACDDCAALTHGLFVQMLKKAVVVRRIESQENALLMAAEFEKDPSRLAAMRAVKKGCPPAVTIVNDELVAAKTFKEGDFITQVLATLS